MTTTSRSTDKTTVVVKHVLMMPVFQARNEAAAAKVVVFVPRLCKGSNQTGDQKMKEIWNDLKSKI
jgi:hypothetical protein